MVRITVRGTANGLMRIKVMVRITDKGTVKGMVRINTLTSA